jgi:adenosylcobinamide-phosphate synthase
MAGALGVWLGGDAVYHGIVKHKPLLGIALQTVTADTLKQALAMKTQLNCVVFAVLISLLCVI